MKDNLNKDYHTFCSDTYRQMEIVELLSNANFVPPSYSPEESTLASVFRYHYETNNFGFNKIIYLKNGNETTGVLLIVVSYLSHNGNLYPCAQGAAGFISPQHRGRFGLLLNEFMLSFKDTFKLFMFSAPAVHKTAANFGFQEIEQSKFEINNHIIIKPFLFIAHKVKFKLIKSSFKVLSKIFDPIIFNLQRLKKCKHEYFLTEDPYFKLNYVSLEEKYKESYNDYLVPEWNAKVLRHKFAKNAILLTEKHFNNSSFVLAVKDSQDTVHGIMILKRVSNLNKLVIVDLQCLTNDKNNITTLLMQYVFEAIKNQNIDSILFNGIGAEYEKILLSKYKVLRKKANLRAFISNDIAKFKNTQPKITLFYSVDDINF